ncbi:hypothetical protein BG015_009012 [Linnemannia schmuckeri]|uniref:Carboxylesterase type B domain-containing protein n=1 Tax=Linnemannia schmuckeri TaxID=64567 RepID=A0A9P5S9B3_9FUNG|nr:hypothetical protein BG015_009012 [Linnemannia schmuckeri]
MKAFILSCILAVASVQSVVAQILIAPEAANATTSDPTFSRSSVPPITILSSVQVLAGNDLEVGGAKYSFIFLSNVHSAALSARGCLKLGEQLYTVQDQALPSVQKIFAKHAAKSTQFNVNGGIDTSSCSVLTIAKGLTSISHKASCHVSLPALCSNTNTKGSTVTVQASLGRFTGLRDKYGFRFNGIRYAQPLTVKRRFAAPVPIPTRWNNNVYATKLGGICRQPAGGSDDCLFLDVFTPKLNAGKSGLLPVMFYIHGGPFINEAGSDPSFDGANMASRGQVVVVTINYRLGVFGFFERVDAGISRKTIPGNQGVRDRLLALKWVQDNIASFGVTRQVTVFGESSASQVVSGGIMKILGCADKDINCMRSKNTTEIIHAQTAVVSRAIALAPEEFFMELIKPTLIAGKNGGVVKVPFMVGTMKNEGNGFLPSLGQSAPVRDIVFGITADAFLGYQRAMITAAYNFYPIDDSIPDATRIVEGLLVSDYLWVCPAQFITKAWASQVKTPLYHYPLYHYPLYHYPLYHYQFQRVYNPTRLASDICHGLVCHGDDIGIVFASLAVLNNPAKYPWTSGDTALSRQVMDRWIAFGVTGGNPNTSNEYPAWALYDATRQSTYMFDLKPTISTGGLRPQFCDFMDQALKYDFQLYV